MITQSRSRMVIGTKENAKIQLDKMIKSFEADEVMIVPLIPGIENRSRAIELIAQMNI